MIPDQPAGTPAGALIDAADSAGLVVPGPRGFHEMNGAGGFAAGSVGPAGVAHAERPMVLVPVRAASAPGVATAPSVSGPAVSPAVRRTLRRAR
ncbi:hypothetical protein AB0N17_40725 [Streptomyces sp. NPDC051133]|uniref:hypothetical protein n=1 Tax=Streptomyces sp. NPDC051133 TaxID=3155521 RepID=UPI003438BF61